MPQAEPQGLEWILEKVKHSNRLSRKVVESPSRDIPKMGSHGALGHGLVVSLAALV